MEGNSDEIGENVSISMEITGTYDRVMSKLRQSEGRDGNLEPMIDDLAVLLDIVVQMDGGTRSAIAKQIPEETTVSYDAEAVVDALQVLGRYELVVLEGNTWKPGPNLHG